MSKVQNSAKKEGEHFVRVEGSGSIDHQKISKIDETSFHKAFLLGWLLGRCDARPENTMYNPQTGGVSEIDNEQIGFQGYDELGVLREVISKKTKIKKRIVGSVV